MNVASFEVALKAISHKINENRDYLIKLDQQNGDGDLGISMSEGFQAVVVLMNVSEEKDLGKLLMTAGHTFNEAAPSSLGTILSFGFMGMARCLKGTEDASPKQLAEALRAAVEKIMEKAGSKPGERTILDALCPAVDAFEAEIETPTTAISKAVQAARIGAEATKYMKPVHGRAAYYGEKSLGHLDGGAVVGQLIFEALDELQK